jgi:hypothetical protein
MKINMTRLHTPDGPAKETAVIMHRVCTRRSFSTRTVLNLEKAIRRALAEIKRSRMQGEESSYHREMVGNIVIEAEDENLDVYLIDRIV